VNRLSVTTVVLAMLSLSLSGGPPDSVQSLADDFFPRISEIAGRIVLANWLERVDDLITSAPSAAVAGSRWKTGDHHWEAAKAAFLSHLDGWIRGLIADPKAREIVRQKFAGRLDTAQAASLQASLKADGTKDFPAWQDSVHLAVLFSENNPELKIGTPEFSSGFKNWLRARSLGDGPPAQTPELMALMRSKDGVAWGMVRGSAMDSLIIGLDGQLQLKVFDAQKALLEEIGREATACAQEHR